MVLLEHGGKVSRKTVFMIGVVSLLFVVIFSVVLIFVILIFLVLIFTVVTVVTVVQMGSGDARVVADRADVDAAFDLRRRRRHREVVGGGRQRRKRMPV